MRFEKFEKIDGNSNRLNSADDTQSTARVYSTLREQILDKRLRGGTKVNQPWMAKELAVSRTPVVKALHRLEAEGLVDRIPHKGFYVHRMTIKELFDYYVLLEALHSILIDDILKSITPKNLRKLDSFFAPFSTAPVWTNETKSRYLNADHEFHYFLLSLSKNCMVTNFNRTFRILNRATRVSLLRPPSESLAEHRAIIQALRQKDRREASRLLVAHFTVGKEILQGIVEHLNSLGMDPQKIPIEDLPQTGVRRAGA